MITEAILKFLAAVASFVVGLFPSVTLPDWFTSTSAYIAEAVTSASAFSRMLPVTALRLSFVFLLACLAAAFAIRLFRIGLSAFTGGGGSAA